MKIKKIIAAFAAAVTSVSLLAVSASALDINKDFKSSWAVNTTISSTEFADVTEDSVITFTYTADPSVADMEGHDYWVIKTMFNDNGWPFINDISQLKLSESADSYELDITKNKVSFTLSAGAIEHLQTAGMAIMGHGITLETMTISNDSDIDTILAAEPNYSPAEDAETAPAAPDNLTDTPVTGNCTAAAAVTVMALAAAAVFAAKKR